MANQSKAAPRSDTAADRLRARLDPASPGYDEQLAAQVECWARMRPFFARNEASSGLGALDNLAVSVLVGDEAAPLAVQSMVVLLPPADQMNNRETLPHAIFEPDRPTGAQKRPATRSATTASKRRKTTTSSKKLAKVKRKVVKEAVKRYVISLPDDCPDKIKKDIAAMLEKAWLKGKLPFRLAYLWGGQLVWYDPKEFPVLHLAHWHFWMRCREAFFLLALYAPSAISETRRKHKAYVLEARLVFISKNIVVFGCYGFLRRFENGAHDSLMWLGGKPTKHSASAKKSQVTDAPEDLQKLLKNDPARYARTFERLLEPSEIDEDGYASIPELLTQTEALTPTKTHGLRLSDHALARVVLDVSSGSPENPAWVGNRTRGTWKALMSCAKLRPLQVEIATALANGTYIPPLQEKKYTPEEKTEDDSDFEDEDEPTVKPPTPPTSVSTTSASAPLVLVIPPVQSPNATEVEEETKSPVIADGSDAAEEDAEDGEPSEDDEDQDFGEEDEEEVEDESAADAELSDALNKKKTPKSK